jgi:hypothetical protein
MKNHWELIVGNLGTVYSGTDGFHAIVDFNEYVKMSKDGYGRVAGEPVTLFKNGEVHKEYEP